MFKYQPYFPYKKIRSEQEIAIEFALDSYINKKKRFVVVEAGTGVGKSAIGYTIAKYIVDNLESQSTYTKAAYYLTTQKILQTQYMDDFSSSGMLSLKSSSNYRCKFYKTKTCHCILNICWKTLDIESS